ncbi:MAG: hypothetical protein DMF68_05530 [Acidobacteria bacterium]|nr:MAG: hypothetical protein DMF68_05530 [Acidobacteriota bacterium]
MRVENRKRCVRLVRRSLMQTKDEHEFISNATLFQGKDYEKQNSEWKGLQPAFTDSVSLLF